MSVSYTFHTFTLQQQGENNTGQCCSLIFCKQHTFYVDSFFTLHIPVTIMLQHCCCIKYFDWSVTQIQGIHQNQQHFGVLTTTTTTATTTLAYCNNWWMPSSFSKNNISCITQNTWHRKRATYRVDLLRLKILNSTRRFWIFCTFQMLIQ